MDQEQNMIGEIAPFVTAGFAIHWLKPKSKAPVDDKWSEAPIASLQTLKATYRSGYNVGVRPGRFSNLGNLYLHLIDLDIRKPEKGAEARAWLKQHLPEAAHFPMVISGSGGDSRHIYFLTDQPFRKKTLAQSEGFEMVFSKEKGHDVKKRDWQIDLYGSGVQAAMPPSIHPETGLPYRWVRPFDFDELDLGGGPIIASDRVFSWDPQRDESTPAPTNTLGMSLEEAKRTLAHLPLNEWCEDRDGWLQVGMALHHEFGGSDQGFDLWVEFSKQSTKFNAKDQKAVWKSFRAKPTSVRMATLVKASHIARLHDMFDEESDEDDLGETEGDDDEDFLGAAPAAEDDDEFDFIGNAPAKKAEVSDDPDNEDWKQLLDLTDGDKPAIKPSLPNIELILAHDPRTRGVIRFNEFTQEIVYLGEPGKLKRNKRRTKPTKQLTGRIWKLQDPINGDMWSDAKDDALRALLESPKSQGGWGLSVADRNVESAIHLVAHQNSFHPLQDYLNDLVWDGVPRVDTMFIDHLGTPDNAYNRAISRLVVLGGVTRAFEPGHKFDYVAILEGKQGERKSSFIKALGRSWFAELHGDFSNTQQMIERMQGYWMLELPELSGFSKAEVEVIKAFVSAEKDTARLAYARRAGQHRRQSLFLGSTNNQEYLRDQTGGRRFWPVECTVASIDIPAFRKVVDQIWAEAVVLYRQMRAEQPEDELPLYLSDDEAAIEAARLQENRRVETAEDQRAGQIEAWLDKPLPIGFDDADDEGLGVADAPMRERTCLIEIWVECLGNDIRNYDGRAAQLLGRAMKGVPGWLNVGLRDFEKYGRQRAYVRVAQKH